MRNFFIETFGCRCNQADSACMRESLCARGLEEVSGPCEADLIVVNSCTVTQRADQQVRQSIRRLQRESPGARVVVTGCYAERDPETLAALPGVGRLLGNADKERLAEIALHEAPDSLAKVIRSPLPAAMVPMAVTVSRAGGRTRPLVKIQDGCDAGCSYCIVPYVRGAGRSAPFGAILAEVRLLIEAGYREIVLTGVHLGSYGRKMDDGVGLADLLRRILALPGLGRLRLSSIEAMGFDRGIVHLAAEHPEFARHFHIPIQSGSDRILRLMRRPYTARRVLDLLQYIHDRLPTAALGTDVMVGFPGEGDEEFEETRALVEKAPLAYLHVFPFSPRPGTEACTLPGRLRPAVIRERTRVLREISSAKNLAFRRKFLGCVMKGVTLAKETEMEEVAVLTENYIHASVASAGLRPNQMVSIRIEDVQPRATHATVVPPS